MTQATDAKSPGRWLRRHDEHSARYAVQMSGLPVFFLGIRYIIADLPFGGGHTAVSKTELPILLGVGLLLITIALRIRAKRAGWLPIVIGIVTAIELHQPILWFDMVVLGSVTYAFVRFFPITSSLLWLL